MSKHATPVRGLMSAPRSPLFQGHFGRMFPGLTGRRYGTATLPQTRTSASWRRP